MAKADKFYFDNLVEAAEVSHKAAVYLVYCLKNYNKDEIKTMLEKMRDFFEARLDDYDAHMMTNIEGADEFYSFTARQLPTTENCRMPNFRFLRESSLR